MVDFLGAVIRVAKFAIIGAVLGAAVAAVLGLGSQMVTIAQGAMVPGTGLLSHVGLYESPVSMAWSILGMMNPFGGPGGGPGGGGADPMFYPALLASVPVVLLAFAALTWARRLLSASDYALASRWVQNEMRFAERRKGVDPENWGRR